MQDQEFADTVKAIHQKDSRFDREAYYFVREALDFTSKMLNKPAEGSRRHVSGIELLEGIRGYAIQELGPMSRTVLNSWGIQRTEDFGEIVFNLVETGKLGKTDEDRREDFANGYDFHEVFIKPFLPLSARKAATKEKQSGRTRKSPTRKET